MKKLMDLFIVFFRIGAFTFGGGFAMIPLIEKEVVTNKDWVSKDDFIDIVAIAQTLPGPMAINTAVFVGYKMNGVLGSLIAILGASLPSFMIILVIAIFFAKFNDNPIVKKIFAGIRPAVVALIAVAVFSVGEKIKRDIYTYILIALFSILLIFLNFNPILAIIIGALIGIFFRRERKQ